VESSNVESANTATPPARQKTEIPAENPPQHLASMHLVTQARAYIDQGSPDAAIPLLEQAIHVDVYNGEAFFNLARAWQMKGVKQKAIEFAKKAEILLQDDRAKLRRVYLLQADLYSETGDVRNADAYRKKAQSIRKQ
jgi:tetratricopeptide (TPR) repeat protein